MPMTVKDLRELLAGLPDDRPVVTQGSHQDYSPLDGGDREIWYTPESTWAGELHHPSDVENGEVELTEHSVQVVALHPTN